MDMPLVRSRNVAGTLPNGESLNKLLQVLTTKEAAEYFSKEYIQDLVGAKKDKEFAALIDEVKDFPIKVAMQESTDGSEWDGKKPLAPFQRFQANLSNAADATAPSGKDIMFGYIIDDQSNYLGGFVADKKTMDEAGTQAMNVHFNSWLAAQNKSKQDGVIYEATTSGQILMGEKGEPLKANPDELRALIEDKDKGFSQFMSERDDSIRLATHHFTQDEVQALIQEQEEPEATMSASSSH